MAVLEGGFEPGFVSDQAGTEEEPQVKALKDINLNDGIPHNTHRGQFGHNS